MTKPTIPTADTVDVDVLNDVLGANGVAGRIAGFDAEPVGTGQIGRCIRYTLHPERPGSDCPRALVAKFPSDDELSRATGVALRNYLREVRFYQHLQSQLDIQTPRCWYADIDDEGPTFAIFMDDLAPARAGDQLAGCGPDVARAAALELVGLHAPSWNRAELLEYEWLFSRPDPDGTTTQDVYGNLLGPFFDRFRHRLEPEEAAIIERVASSTGAPWHTNPDAQSLVHVDYRLDNVLIETPGDGGPPSITVVDWQSVTAGNPLIDVAYFLGAGLDPATRPDVEPDIVAAYHRALLDAGVEDYDWDRCWTDYRRGSFHGFVITVVASTIVVETPRGNDMFTAMAQRHARHALDLGAEEFL